MLENLITQIACNLSPPATANAPVWSPLSHFNISLQIQYIHRQMHIHLLCFVCQQLTKSLGIFIFNQTRKHYCFPHSAHEVILPFGLPSLHLYCTGSIHCCWIHTNHRNLHRHAQWTCSVIEPCSTYKDKGTGYMHWASATTCISAPSKPCRKTLPVECFPMNKTSLSAQDQYMIQANPVPTHFLTFPFLILLIQGPWTDCFSLLHTNCQSVLLHIHSTPAGFTVIPFCRILITLLANARQ